MPVHHKLANIVLHIDEHALRYPELYYRSDHAPELVGTIHEEGPDHSLVLPVRADFLTYLNALPACKWHAYARISRVHLRVVAKGAGRLLIDGIATGASIADRQTLASVEVTSTSLHEYILGIDITGEDLVGLVAEPSTGESLTISSAAWYAEVEPSAINPVRLALATTTFKKERYITANMDLVHRGISAEGGPVADSFHMFVVDNGRTLDVDALDSDFVTIIPNPNVGGSGGFARGMMAAMDSPEPFTHVLVMDDDVRIIPESIIRTFNLLSLARGRYKNAFINGAMLSLENPVRQFEDVSYVAGSSAYFKIKDDLNVGKLEDVLLNERESVEIQNAYGAWWYSVIPIVAIKKNGLPVPFFIRCDDVEFGMRNHPTYMTMGGICVWHESFEGRFRASVDCYQYIRNFFAMIAMDDCSSERLFVVRISRFVRDYLRYLDYTAAEMVLDGFEDYLKGPEYLEHLDGSALMKANGVRNEKLVPVQDLDQRILSDAGVTPSVLSKATFEFHPSRLKSIVRSLPYDKHYLPAFLLSKRSGYAVKNGIVTLEEHSWACDTLVFLDPTRTKGAIRRMDRARFKAIRKRERELFRRYRAEGKRVRQEWRAALPYLSSREFWEKYLKERAED